MCKFDSLANVILCLLLLPVNLLEKLLASLFQVLQALVEVDFHLVVLKRKVFVDGVDTVISLTMVCFL